MNAKLRKIVIIVAALNLTYFGVEFAVALAIGSVSLFADSIDFLEDTSINFLIAIALGWSATRRARVGMALAGILLVPGIATLWTAWQKFMAPFPSAPVPLSLADALANVSIIAAGFMTAYTLSGWPDLIVGLGIAAINADAAREVWTAAREEHRAANT